MELIIGIAIGVVGGYVLGRYSKNPASLKNPSQTTAKEENLTKVVDLARAQVGIITNSDVERLLGVSDATAERYLQELEIRGTLRQVGKTGPTVQYELTTNKPTLKQ